MQENIRYLDPSPMQHDSLKLVDVVVNKTTFVWELNGGD